jgi:heterodisulfide reductase subunit A2
MKERIGVYICHCGGNISDYVDVKQISELVKNENGVIISKDVMFACADSNQVEMIKDIKENNLDSIVVASCSPKLHLHTFRNVAERAGINQYNYVQVNIREQCSWPHSDKPKDATVKAIGLIRAGINRVAYSESLEDIEIKTQKAVVVIGAGVAGMKAAIELSRSGNEVYLLEQDYFVGGRVAASNTVFMSDQKGKEIVAKLYAEIKKQNNITLFTGTSIEKVSGSLGNFHVDIKITPRYIAKNYDAALLNSAIEECQVNVYDDFNLGLFKRKAIYKNYPEALPDVPVVNLEAIKTDKSFVDMYAKCFNLAEEPQFLSLHAGAIIVTTGFDNYQPKQGEYEYKNIGNVITLPELKRLIELNNDQFIFNNKQVKKVSFIYCVGSCQTEGENKYCSRICCTAAIHTSLLLKEKYKDIKTMHLYREIRTYGKQEILFEKSSKQGDVFIKFDETAPPLIEKKENNIHITVKDILTNNKELELETDLVVLVTGMVPRTNSLETAKKLKIPTGNDKFFNEIHPKLKPVETVIKGVYIGGACQGPKNITESVQSALSATAKVSALIKSGSIMLEPIIARINHNSCIWCGKCEVVCEYDALKQTEINGKMIAMVNKASCTGCGICAPVCPSDSIELIQYTNNEIEGMIDGFTKKIELQEKEETEAISEEKASVGMKEYPEIWKKIASSIKEEAKTIPQISKELGIKNDIITYNIMTMNKYSIVDAEGIDDMDEYYLYKLKN